MVLVILVMGGVLGYVAVEGSARFVAAYASDTCATPASEPYGWQYQAINDDQADDANLAASNPDMNHCTDQGVGAGTAVVAEDGTRLAGWYIPAASPAAGRPTLLLVHGHDSAHAQWQTLLERQIERTPVVSDIHQPAYPGAWAASLGIWIRTGEDIGWVDPIDSLQALGAPPILFIHGTADDEDIPELSADRNYAAALASGIDADLEYCQGGGHAGLATACPEEYRARVNDFLDEAFGTPSAGG